MPDPQKRQRPKIAWRHWDYHHEIELDAIREIVVQTATPEAMALRIGFGLPAEPEKVPIEEGRILAAVGDGYMAPA